VRVAAYIWRPLEKMVSCDSTGCRKATTAVMLSLLPRVSASVTSLQSSTCSSALHSSTLVQHMQFIWRQGQALKMLACFAVVVSIDVPGSTTRLTAERTSRAA
jgi:hypothetical protein